LLFVDYVRKDARLSPLFCTASDENWAGPGNEASLGHTSSTSMMRL